MVIAAGAVGARGEISGDVVRVGYEVTESTAIRTGAWAPVVVDLRLQNQASFNGLLRLRQFDRDGDIYVDSVPVHLSDPGAGAQQRYWLYTIANPRDDRANAFEVELLATETGSESDAKLVQVISGGSPVAAMVPPKQQMRLADDVFLILAVSEGQKGRIRHLTDAESAERFDRPIALATASPDDLPSQWIGLEMVDCVVWEDADPTKLTPAQEQALVSWVEQGGKLVVAAGRTADAVAQSSRLAPLLPVRIGRVSATTELPTLRSRLLGMGGEGDKGYPKPVVYASCTLVAEADVKQVVYEAETKSTLVASRRVGRGRLVFVAASLSDLLADPDVDVRTFFQRVLELRSSPVSDQAAQQTYINLFRFLEREIGFYRSGAARLAVAILFAVAYVLTATLGAWKILQSREQLKHSWTVLALVAAAASVLGLVGVQVVHGVGAEVRQVTVVDAAANQVGAHATAYFGLKTATHDRLDIWLPSDYRMEIEPTATGCTLEPLLEAEETIERSSGFTDPGRYWLAPSTAEARDVPLRATLKQFEGRWRGDLRGTVLSSVTAADVFLPDDGDEQTVKVAGVSRDSWIENGLDVDLQDCQLFLAEASTFKPPYFPFAGQRSGATHADTSRMRVFRIGRIAAGERINLYERLFGAPAGRAAELSKYHEQSLYNAAQNWGRTFISLGDMTGFGGEERKLDYRFEHYQYVLLLMTVHADVDPMLYGLHAIYGLRHFSRARMRHLDMADHVQEDMALLVGFTNEGGPVRLCVRGAGRTKYAPLDPEYAQTVYRFLIPVEPAGP
jgi:hypothetical protein